MSKKFVVAVAGLIVAIGFGTGANAGANISRGVTPAQQTVEASASFSVTYSYCWWFETVVFEFEGQTKEVPCPVEPLAQDASLISGIRSMQTNPEQASVTATFTAPATAGDYEGIAYIANDGLQGIRRATAAPLSQGIGRVSQTSTCTDRVACRTFEVTVLPPPTTTEATTTTTTTTTTTVAPTTSDASAVPPAPTTTVAPTLPATGPSRNDNAATIAVVLLVAGGLLVMVTRRRSGEGAA